MTGTTLDQRLAVWLTVCGITVVAALALSNNAAAQNTVSHEAAPIGIYATTATPGAVGPHSVTNIPTTDVNPPSLGIRAAAAPATGNSGVLPTSASWIVPAGTGPDYVDAHVYYDEPPYAGPSLIDSNRVGVWCWQVLPEGLIFRSYQAGMHEPRMGVVLHNVNDDGFWDAWLGGRIGLLRYGSGDPLQPRGWQLDFEGAALPRLTLDQVRDLDAVDFRAGVPLTYGVGNWQFKGAYYHLSSHMGDELIIRDPTALSRRRNYVRDAWLLGASHFPLPWWRIYAEVAYAFNSLGGAEPWELQFGTELSQPGPTGPFGTPFLALNAHLREEHDFGGDFTAQTGWLWRGPTGQALRLGAHYFNGKSSQYQFFDTSEEQIGVGLWYDF